MARFLRKPHQKIGAAPGSLLFVGDQKVDKVAVDAISFNADDLIEEKTVEVASLIEFPREGMVSWINLTGLHEPLLIKEAGDIFGMHLLVPEDILNTNQRPKFEDYGENLFMVVKMLHFDKDQEKIEAEQVSMVVLRNILLTFQEENGDVFDPVRDRLIRPTTKIRHRGSDYLAFALLDAIVDQYISIIEIFGERIESLEDELLKFPKSEHLERIHQYKSEINFLRKTIRPVRILVSQFSKSESALIETNTIPFLKDLEDHIIQCTEAIEVYREMLNDQLMIYDSGMNKRLNDILRVLTIFSVIFIPLTFIAGIYGTNFEYFPELHYKYAYPVFWGTLILIATGMIYFFKRRRWL